MEKENIEKKKLNRSMIRRSKSRKGKNQKKPLVVNKQPSLDVNTEQQQLLPPLLHSDDAEIPGPSKVFSTVKNKSEEKLRNSSFLQLENSPTKLKKTDQQQKNLVYDKTIRYI